MNARLVFGMAPDDIEAVFTQRLRWAMGALQILARDNPLSIPGLTTVQSFLFFESAAHHMLAISTIFMVFVPIPFMFTGFSPLTCPHLWEFTVVFGSFYVLNRVMLWWAHCSTEGGAREMWSGSQMWVWMAPNHVKAIWKVLIGETRLFKWLCNFEVCMCRCAD